ncbi:zinc-finger domain-containing protein [Cytobacillus spongiae]|uniref:zinc-finger domain-containing protein n=1 Tax=Cytobacillus spongiae TaxID=2901381 RepID=UPI001F19A74A|nr:zinc-finger domain-containing protein [Cytobacillus spongiae]UII54555.1 zinc-finger domain-containing protein [Cytobacillus spongiae]
MNRRKVLSEVAELMTTYCEGCFLHKHLKNENGRRNAHRFCITQCTIGERIKKYGEKL